MMDQAAQGVGVPLAKDREQTHTSATIKVSSDTIRAGAAIPTKHSEYADGVAPTSYSSSRGMRKASGMQLAGWKDD